MDAAVEKGRVSRSEVTVPLYGCFPGCGQCFSMPHLGFHTSKCQGFDAKQNCEGVKLYYCYLNLLLLCTASFVLCLESHPVI